MKNNTLEIWSLGFINPIMINEITTYFFSCVKEQSLHINSVYIETISNMYKSIATKYFIQFLMPDIYQA